jgi:hypothetical protein
MFTVTYTTLSVSEHTRAGLPDDPRRVKPHARTNARFPLKKAAERLDSDRVPGTVNSVVTES